MDGICYGRSDVALAADYKASFAAIKTDRDYDRVISSPLSRCTQLADYLSFKYEKDARLQELHFGEWELQKWDSLDREQLQTWSDDYINGAPPMGETLKDMQYRVLLTLEELVGQHPEGKILLITHAGVIRIILSYIMKLPLAEMFSIEVGYGELKKVTIKAWPSGFASGSDV